MFGIMATLGVIQMAQVAHLHKLNALHLRATLALNLAMQAPEFGPDRVAAVRDLLVQIRSYPEECLQSLGFDERLMIRWARAETLIRLCEDDLRLADLTLDRLDAFARGELSAAEILPELRRTCAQFNAHSNAFLAPVTAVGHRVGDLVLAATALLGLIATALVWAIARSINRSVVLMEETTQALASSERHNRRLAEIDSLTGLPNRHLFGDRLQQAVERAQRCGEHFSLLFIDLDRFKDVNDSMGHRAGDELLKLVAAKLPGILRGGDIVARLGGDEFAVILAAAAGSPEPDRVARRLLALLADPMMLSGGETRITASIGITRCPQDGLAADLLLKNADLAMYAAKAAGRNGYCFYSDEIDARMRQRIRDEQMLRLAVERDEFYLHFHPIIHLASGRVVACEALLRWQHPESGPTLPEGFIGIAEDTGLIWPIGAWVLEAAIAQAQRWRHEQPQIAIAVNVSVRQIGHTGFFDLVESLLARYQFPAGQLHLEVTESLLLERSDETRETLQRLGALGVRLCIDDFGTGYSSFGYLRQLPFRQLKIDRSFIRNTPDNTDAVAVTTAIVRMAHSLEMEVVAEGIESVENLSYLCGLGCGFGQGFWFTEPLPAERIDLAACYAVPLGA